MKEFMRSGKRGGFVMILFCMPFLLEWWFLSSMHSGMAIAVVLLLLGLLFLCYCAIALLLPEPPIPQRVGNFSFSSPDTLQRKYLS